MVKTLALHAEIFPGRELCIKVPTGVPPGPAEIIVVIVSSAVPLETAGTAGDMVQSPLFGLWSGRDDIGDSLEYARRLRAQAEQRAHG